MFFSYLKKHLGVFILAVALIAIYKTFDNFTLILDWLGTFSKLLTPFFISFAIAYLLFPACKRIETFLFRIKKPFLYKNRRGIAIFCVYLCTFLIIGVVISFLVPIALKSINDFIEYLPTLIPNIVTFIQDFDFYGLRADSILDNIRIENVLSEIDFSNIFRYAEGVVGFSNALLNIIMGIIISVYILLDRHNLKILFLRISRLYVKPSTAKIAKKYIKHINAFVHKYIFCQLTDAIIVFILMLITFSLFRVRYAAAFAAFMGIFNLIPYFGAIIAGCVTVIVTAFTTSPTTALLVGVAILILQQIDSNIINPALVKDQLSVKPFWVILGILIGGAFFGPLGIFFAAPVMALLKIMINDYLSIKESEQKTSVAESSTAEN